MKSLIWQSVMWRPGKVRFLVRMKNRSISGRPRPPANAPLAGPRRSPDSQRQSGYALLPSRIRQHFLILIDARLSSRSPRSRRSLVEKIGGFREDLPVIQDARFLSDATYHGASFVHSPHLGARYRISLQGLSRRDPARFWRDVLLSGRQI